MFPVPVGEVIGGVGVVEEEICAFFATSLTPVISSLIIAPTLYPRVPSTASVIPPAILVVGSGIRSPAKAVVASAKKPFGYSFIKKNITKNGFFF